MELGDVMLVCGEAFRSKALAALQKPIYLGAKSSHVLFCLGDGCFMHSTDDGGVHLKFIHDELEEVKDDWRVIRLKHLPNSKKEDLRLAGMYFLDQKYNRKFLFSGGETKSFCSELVGRIFEKASVVIVSGVEPHKLTPAHFDKEADAEIMWKDVTAESKEYLESVSDKVEEHRLLFNSLETSIRGNKQAASALNMIVDLIKAVAPSMSDKLDKLYEDNQEQTKVKFWDQPKPKS